MYVILRSSLATVAKDAMTSSKMVDTATVTSQDGDRCQGPMETREGSRLSLE